MKNPVTWCVNSTRVKNGGEKTRVITEVFLLRMYTTLLRKIFRAFLCIFRLISNQWRHGDTQKNTCV